MSPWRAGRTERAWERATREHRASLAALLERLEGLDAAAWSRPRAPGTWSPAQIVEHLALTYEAFLRELEGAGPMRPRAAPWIQRLSRWIVLPHLFFHRSLPVRVAAPRETRPGEQLPEPTVLVARLRATAERLERELAAARASNRTLFSPYFGPLRPVSALRFCAAHLDHHRRQIPTHGVPSN